MLNLMEDRKYYAQVSINRMNRIKTRGRLLLSSSLPLIRHITA